jgi:hypothetical protein
MADRPAARPPDPDSRAPGRRIRAGRRRGSGCAAGRNTAAAAGRGRCRPEGPPDIAARARTARDSCRGRRIVAGRGALVRRNVVIVVVRNGGGRHRAVVRRWRRIGLRPVGRIAGAGSPAPARQTAPQGSRARPKRAHQRPKSFAKSLGFPLPESPECAAMRCSWGSMKAPRGSAKALPGRAFPPPITAYEFG